jgi:hypothetical protein
MLCAGLLLGAGLVGPPPARAGAPAAPAAPQAADPSWSLIRALRADRDEAVRCQAASALARGRCCTKEALAALTLAVTGEATDGNPPETSARVKAAAAHALELCAVGYWPHIPAAAPRDAAPEPAGAAPGQSPAGVSLASYYTHEVARESMARVVQDAGRALASRVGAPRGPRPTASAGRPWLGLLAPARPPSAAEEQITFEEAALGAAGRATAPRGTPPVPAGRGRPGAGVPPAAPPTSAAVLMPPRPAGQ